MLAVVAALVGLAPAAGAARGAVERRTMPADAVSEARDYLVYVPRQLAPPHRRALVVFLHGCSQTATDAMDATPWNALADERGFVVAYPEQSTTVDGNAGRCWNSGQAPLYPRGQHELETLARITRSLRAEHSIPPGRVFVAGLSSGALMAAAMGATYPDVYAAVGSVVGCGYPCGDATGSGVTQRMGPYARVVPGFFVAGSADYLINPAIALAGARGWAAANGATSSEREDRGFDQPVAPGTELCLQYAHNPCPAGAAGWTDYPTTIDRHRTADGTVVVESWLLHGLSHGYPGGHPTAGTFADPHGPDVTTAMFDFFVANAR